MHASWLQKWVDQIVKVYSRYQDKWLALKREELDILERLTGAREAEEERSARMEAVRMEEHELYMEAERSAMLLAKVKSKLEEGQDG